MSMTSRQLTVSFSIVLVTALLFTSRVQHSMASKINNPTTQPVQDAKSPLDFVVKDINGRDVNLADYKGKVVMIVNVASKCGFTPQYKGLEAMYEKYKDQGFVVIAFPANNFRGQEPGSDEEIKKFCTETYNVTFPMMAKISVKGDDKAPIYRWLTEPNTALDFAGEIGWNFTKFLIGRDGQIAGRWPSKVQPDDPALAGYIEKKLAEK